MTNKNNKDLTLKKFILLAATWFLAAPVFAEIDSNSGNYWHMTCSTNPNGTCLTFVIGVSEGIKTYGNYIYQNSKTNMVSSSPTGFCPPEGVTIGQLRDVFIKMMENYPEYRNYPASTIAYSSWLQAWPCATEKKEKAK